MEISGLETDSNHFRCPFFGTSNCFAKYGPSSPWCITNIFLKIKKVLWFLHISHFWNPKVWKREKTGADQWWRFVLNILEILDMGSIYCWKHEMKIWYCWNQETNKNKQQKNNNRTPKTTKNKEAINHEIFFKFQLRDSPPPFSPPQLGSPHPHPGARDPSRPTCCSKVC